MLVPMLPNICVYKGQQRLIIAQETILDQTYNLYVQKHRTSNTLGTWIAQPDSYPTAQCVNKEAASHQLTDAHISNYHSNTTTLTLMMETGQVPKTKP